MIQAITVMFLMIGLICIGHAFETKEPTQQTKYWGYGGLLLWTIGIIMLTSIIMKL